MRFEVEMKTDFQQLRTLNGLAERTFRFRTMLIFRLVMLGLTALLGWNIWLHVAAEGMGFISACKSVAALALLLTAVIPNTISALFGRAVLIPGSMVFDEKAFSEVAGSKKRRHEYREVEALMRYRGYDFVFLEGMQRSFILAPDSFTAGSAAELRPFLEEKTGKTFRRVGAVKD